MLSLDKSIIMCSEVFKDVNVLRFLEPCALQKCEKTQFVAWLISRSVKKRSL